MGQNLQAVEDWVEILPQTAVASGVATVFTAPFTLMATSGALGEPCAALEWKMKVDQDFNDDIDLDFQRGDGGGTPYATLLEDVALVEAGGEADPFYAYGFLDHEAIGPGGRFALGTTESAGTTPFVTMWIRRYRYV